MKCLVTGAAGHVGCTIVRALIEKGHDVSVYVRKTSDLSSLILPEIRFIFGELDNSAALEEAISGCDIVFHCAGIVYIGSGHYDELYKVNYCASRLIADICLKLKKRLLYMSSVHSLRVLPKGEVMRETTEYDPDLISGNYGKTKALATGYILDLAKKGLQCAVVQPSGIIGPYDFRVSNIGDFIIKYARGKVPSYLDGMYNFVDVRDVAEASINAALSEKTGESYLLTGERLTVPRFVEYLEEITGIKKPAFKTPFPIVYSISPFMELYAKLTGTTMVITPFSLRTLRSNDLFDCSKAVSEIGFKARPVYDSIKDTYLWFKENGYI